MASMFQQPSSVQAEMDGKHAKKGSISEDASVSASRKKATVRRSNSQINRFSSAKKMFESKSLGQSVSEVPEQTQALKENSVSNSSIVSKAGQEQEESPFKVPGNISEISNNLGKLSKPISYDEEINKEDNITYTPPLSSLNFSSKSQAPLLSPFCLRQTIDDAHGSNSSPFDNPPPLPSLPPSY